MSENVYGNEVSIEDTIGKAGAFARAIEDALEDKRYSDAQWLVYELQAILDKYDIQARR